MPEEIFQHLLRVSFHVYRRYNIRIDYDDSSLFTALTTFRNVSHVTRVIMYVHENFLNKCSNSLTNHRTFISVAYNSYKLCVANYQLKSNRSGQTDRSISRTSNDLTLKVEEV